MLKFTPRELLAKQAEQIAWYAPRCANLAALVAAATDVSGLDMDRAYPASDLHTRIPRGGSIEYIMERAALDATAQPVGVAS
jgi:hypothetical protein